MQAHPMTAILGVSASLHADATVTIRMQIIIDVRLDGHLFARRGTSECRQCQKFNILLSYFH